MYDTLQLGFLQDRAQGAVSVQDAVRLLVLVLPLPLGRLHERLKVVDQVVPVEVLVEQGADREFVRELPLGVGVHGALEHPEHLARAKVLQQCHCRPPIQAAAVALRLKLPEERHQPQRRVTRELPRRLHQSFDNRANAADGVASREVQAASSLCQPVPLRRQ